MLKGGYGAMFERCRQTFGAFLHDFDPRSAFDVSDQEREVIFERLWNEPGCGFWLGHFHNIVSVPRANETIAESRVLVKTSFIWALPAPAP